jgi:hypothetical protein
MSLREFLRTKTYTRELCIIREDGWAVAVCWIDYEDLFCIPLKLADRPVKSDEWGFLPTTTESGDTVIIQCHYIDV